MMKMMIFCFCSFIAFYSCRSYNQIGNSQRSNQIVLEKQEKQKNDYQYIRRLNFELIQNDKFELLIKLTNNDTVQIQLPTFYYSERYVQIVLMDSFSRSMYKINPKFIYDINPPSHIEPYFLIHRNKSVQIKPPFYRSNILSFGQYEIDYTRFENAQVFVQNTESKNIPKGKYKAFAIISFDGFSSDNLYYTNFIETVIVQDVKY